MGQNAPTLRVTLGGDTLHQVAIMLVTRMCHDQGYSFENPDWLGRKSIYPGVPDVYAKRRERSTDSSGRACSFERYYIFEIETNASKASVEKKKAQFRDSTMNHELIIFDLKHVKNKDSLKQLNDYLKERMP